MPNDKSAFTFVIYPLQSGYCKLPRFHMKLNNFNFKTTSQDNNNITLHQQNVSQQPNASAAEKGISGEATENTDLTNLESVVQSMLPTQIFIMPQTTSIASSS